MLLVKDLRDILATVPDHLPVIIDSQEQSCAYYAATATIQTIQEPEDEDVKDDMDGDVGDPNWVGDTTPHEDALWISRWDWRG